tara:strand:+ start:6737 stop:7981 length:1245 start_codon:yes stop_codon:yes gene_type:complete
MPSKPADYEIANDTGANVRTDLNNVFNAIQINNGYGSEPTTKLGFMWYADTSSNKMSFYKATPSDGRISFIHLANGNFFGPDGTVSDPSYTFENQSSTGFYKAGTNIIGISNNSVSMAELRTDRAIFKGVLDVIPNSGGANLNVQTNGVNDQDANIRLVADTSFTTAGFSITRKASNTGSTELVHRGTGDLVIDTDEAADMVFKTDSTMRLSLMGSGTEEGSLISHDHTRNTLDTAGFAFVNTSNDNGAGFEMLSLVKSGNATGAALFINRLASAGLPDTGSTGRLVEFEYNGTNVGSITTNGSTTAFNTGSDYRLKENIVDLTDGITRLKTLKPCRFNFKTNTTKIVDGFLAHEVTTVPEAVTGVKDDVDSNGNPVYQQIDQSKLVPLLTAALQEAIVKIETLETKVAALEAS